MPNIIDVDELQKIKIFGKDYDTKDGTCINYIHIMDLANAHYKSLQFLEKSKGLIYLILAQEMVTVF